MGYYKKPVIIRTSTHHPITNPSIEQLAIFEHIKTSSKSLIIQALAGCGKTATCVEAMYQLPPNKKIVYVIFANRNAREAEGKCPERVDVSTVHAFGLAAIRAAYGKIVIDSKDEKATAIAVSLIGNDPEKAELIAAYIKALGLAKGYLCETAFDVSEACIKHDIDMNLCESSEEEFCSNIIKGMNLSVQQTNRIDFNDMIYFPIKKNLKIKQYDVVFADECQDLSPARVELVLRAVKSDGKLVAVGDENQAIFGFSGADKDAMKKLHDRTNADVLSLNTTYRCAKKIVELAREFVPDYTAYNLNTDGVVENKTQSEMMSNAGPGDLILSRTNAPLVGYCLQFLKAGRRANIMGRDMGSSLSYMIKRSKMFNVNSFLLWLEEWKNLEIKRLSDKKKDYQHITDRYECMIAFCEGTNDLGVVKDNIKKMFDDKEDSSIITLATCHRFKGMERPTAFILRDTFKPDKGTEERNIYYVAITRAKTHLYIVNGKTN